MNRLSFASIAISISCLTVSATAGQTSSDAVAQAMVKAMRDTHAMGQLGALSITLEGEEKTAFEGVAARVFRAAMATTGETLAPVQQFQLATNSMGWYMSRRPLTPAVIAK